MRHVMWSALLLAAIVFTGCKQGRIEQNLQEAVQLIQVEGAPNWESAREHLETCRALGSQHETVLSMLALARLHTLDPEGALEAALLTSRLYPDNFVAQFVAGKSQLVQRRPAEALPYLKRAHEMRPGDESTLILLVQAAAQTRDANTIQYFRLLEATPGFAQMDALYNARAMYHYRNGNIPVAIGDWNRAQQLPNPHAAVFWNAAVAYDTRLSNHAMAFRNYLMHQRHAQDLESRMQVQQRIQQLNQQRISQN